MSEKHTPLPWVAVDDGLGTIKDADGNDICDCMGSDFGPNSDAYHAAMIVRAVNSHAELVAALELFTSASMGETRPSRGESSIGWQASDGLSASERVAIANRVLARAKVQP